MKRSSIAFKNISSNLVLQFVVIISGFIIPKLLISSFGSDTYGLVASITQFLSLIVLLEAGMGPVVKAKLYKYIAKDDKGKIQLILKDADKFFKTIGYIFIAYIIVLCFVFPYMNNEFDSALSISLIIIIAISTLFEYFFGIVYNLYLQADKKYYVTSWVQVFCYIFNILLVVILIHFGASIIVVKIANTLAFIIKPIFQSWYVRKKLDMHFKNVNGEYKIDNKFDGLSQHIAYVINNNTDVMVLTVFSNLATVAVYSIYNLVAQAINRIVSAFTNGMDSIFGDMFARDERDVLSRSFSMYEFVYYTVSMIFYLTTLVLIVPFIRIYMNGVNDANYIQPLFGTLIVVVGFIATTRTVYSSLVYSIGHFKQTNFVVWIEAITNIVLSIIFVYKFGLIGVMMGSFVASMIRLVYFMFYSSKIILNRSIFVDLKWLFIMFLEIIIVVLLMNFNIISYIPANYFEWLVYAIIILLLVIIFVIILNVLFNHKLAKEVFYFLKGKFSKQKAH